MWKLAPDSTWKHLEEPVGYFSSLISAPFSWLWEPAEGMSLWTFLSFNYLIGILFNTAVG